MDKSGIIFFLQCFFLHTNLSFFKKKKKRFPSVFHRKCSKKIRPKCSQNAPKMHTKCSQNAPPKNGILTTSMAAARATASATAAANATATATAEPLFKLSKFQHARPRIDAHW
jgi:hypothetical protein